MISLNLIKIVTGEIVCIKNIESVQFYIIIEGKLEEIKFIKIYYYLDLNLNFISLRHFEKNEVCFEVENGMISVIKDEIIYFKIYKTNKIYIFNTSFIKIVNNKFK